jgi:hypothetical protein
MAAAPDNPQPTAMSGLRDVAVRASIALRSERCRGERGPTSSLRVRPRAEKSQQPRHARWLVRHAALVRLPRHSGGGDKEKRSRPRF